MQLLQRKVFLAFIMTAPSFLDDSATDSFRREVANKVKTDPLIAGGLIRLAFHDAATYDKPKGGPNGSILYELGWSENRGLGKALGFVQEIQTDLNIADAIALAGAAAVEAVGGPNIPIRMGRPVANEPDPKYLKKPLRMETSRSLVDTTLPSAALDSDGLRLYFGKILGLSEEEFVALSGSHGLGRHVTLLNMTKSCLRNLTRDCLEDAPVSLPFVSKSVDCFDNSYFTTLLRWYDRQLDYGEASFIPTDVAMVVDPGLREKVVKFANDEGLYRETFRRAYQKLVDRTATSRSRF